MLMESKHLIPWDKQGDKWYIVCQRDKHGKREPIYVKHYGVEKYPTMLDDQITETTPDIGDAIMFCNKEDAEKVAKLCRFKCNCGCVDNHGVLLEVTRSGRIKDGVTYGSINYPKRPNFSNERFEVIYDVKEVK